jgi:hypothetical protein
VGSAEEASLQHPLALVIHLPADQLPAQGLLNLREAIHNYFAYRRDQEDRRLRLLFRDGRIALLIGLGFLFCCMLLRELAKSFGNDATSDIFGEGMLIIGWVAIWRPLEIFLYEWGADPPPIPNTCEACRNANDCTVEAHRLTISASFGRADEGAIRMRWRMSAFGTKQTSQCA